jgi:hypothetical protein
MFTVYSCCQPFRLLQSVPPNITSFRCEMDSKWTVSKTAKNCPQAIATPSICPCSVLTCSRPNSDQYRRSLRISSGQSLRQPQATKGFFTKEVWILRITTGAPLVPDGGKRRIPSPRPGFVGTDLRSQRELFSSRPFAKCCFLNSLRRGNRPA